VVPRVPEGRSLRALHAHLVLGLYVMRVDDDGSGPQARMGTPSRGGLGGDARRRAGARGSVRSRSRRSVVSSPIR
jgi:hypothetical protein